MPRLESLRRTAKKSLVPASPTPIVRRCFHLVQYNGEKYAGLARILYPPDGAFQAANAASGAAPSKPEHR